MSHAVRISGATRLYAIIGDPIAQVRSPEVFSERFAATGVDAVLVPVHVPDRSFDVVVPALLKVGNLDGILVTVPFKPRMLAFADRLGATQERSRRQCVASRADGSWTGDMFDGAGFVRGAERKGERVRGRHGALRCGRRGQCDRLRIGRRRRELDRCYRQDHQRRRPWWRSSQPRFLRVPWPP